MARSSWDHLVVVVALVLRLPTTGYAKKLRRASPFDRRVGPIVGVGTFCMWIVSLYVDCLFVIGWGSIFLLVAESFFASARKGCFLVIFCQKLTFDKIRQFWR